MKVLNYVNNQKNIKICFFQILLIKTTKHINPKRVKNMNKIINLNYVHILFIRYEHFLYSQQGCQTVDCSFGHPTGYL